MYFSDIHDDTIVPDERVSHYFALLLFDEYKLFNFSWRKRLRKSLADISLQGLRAADLSIRLINEANNNGIIKKSAILCPDNEDKDDDYFVSPSQKTPASTPPTFLFWMPAEKQWMVRTVDHWLSHPSPPTTCLFLPFFLDQAWCSLFTTMWRWVPRKGTRAEESTRRRRTALPSVPAIPPLQVDRETLPWAKRTTRDFGYNNKVYWQPL